MQKSSGRLYSNSWFAFLPAVLLCFPLFIPLCAVAKDDPPPRYVVLMVTGIDGKAFHKAMADKDQDVFKKDLNEKFTKEKRSHADEKKAFLKESDGKKFEKVEPQKPKVQVLKRDIKSFNEAQRAAFDLDKDLEKAKSAKNSKNGKNGAAEKSEKNGKNGSEKEKAKE